MLTYRTRHTHTHTHTHDTREGVYADVQDTALHAGTFLGSAKRLEVLHEFVYRLLGLTAVRNFAS
jgi:hypothetical protein